ncbi:MAG: hypothetical protein HY303_12095, partial [Candidatus Wallbacteria bacterium]|nr:hypothetical protein [Candidatus Wallbacteria bacterium]
AADGALDGRAFASAVLLTDRSGGLVSYTADTPTREFQAAVRQFMADTVPVGPNNPPTLTGISVGTTRATTNLPVLLSGTGISDPNGDTLSYLWTATLNGRNVEVFGRFAPSAILLPPLAVGTYDVRLTVWDPGGLTAPIAGASVPVFPAP